MSERKEKASIAHYAFLLVLLAAVRIFDLSTTSLNFRHASYESSFAWVAVSCVAALVCWVGTTTLRSRFSPVVAIAVSVVLGAASTLLVSSVPGMVVGLIVGVVTTFGAARKLLRKSWQVIWVAAVPALGLTILGGFLAGLSNLTRVQQRYEMLVASTVLLCLFALSIGWNRWRDVSKATTLVFLVVSLLGWPCGLQLDTARRASWAGQQSLPLGNARFFRLTNYVRGFVEPTSFRSVDGITRRQGRMYRPFGSLTSLHVYTTGRAAGDHAFNSEGFRELDLRHLESFATAPWCVSGTTDEVLYALDNATQLFELNIPNSDVTDAGLVTLQNKPGLTSLDLSASSINGDGLTHLHAKAPLNYVDLSATAVDDTALQHLSGRVTGNLKLNQTMVTGVGFQNLPLKSLRGLWLANGRFEERYIELLPPSVEFLDISGTDLTIEGMTSLKGMPRLQSLRIVQTDIDDRVVQELPRLRELEIDATNLSLKSCQTLAEIQDVKLEFRAEAFEFADLIEKARSMSIEIERLRSHSGLAIAIRGLHVTKQMTSPLKELDCTLYSATFEKPVSKPPEYEYESRLKLRGFQLERH